MNDQKSGDDGVHVGLEGIDEYTGERAARAARAMEREAARGEAEDPIDGLAKRIKEMQAPELAFDPTVIAMAVELRATDAGALEIYRGELKAAGVGIGRWDECVKAAVRDKRKAAKEADRQGARQRANERRAAASAERAAEQERRAALRERAATDVDLHHADGTDGNGSNFVMEPGMTRAEVTTRGEVQNLVLAHFSARITSDVSEYLTPDVAPLRRRVLSVVCEGDAAVSVIEVPSPLWHRGDWLEAMIPARGRTPVDRKLRGQLLDAIGACSSPAVVRRYGFTGWVIEGGRAMYLHAGGAIDARGEVPGVHVAPRAPADRCLLPLAQGVEETNASALALLELLAVEPAAVIVPIVGLAFRAAMGPTRATVHVTGRPGLGKTTLAGLVASLFGAAMLDTAPCSWANDSAPGIFGVASTIGDALLFIDDLNLAGGGNVDNRSKFERVIRAKYDGQGRNLRHADGTARTDPRPRSAILSTGEVLPTGAACTSRVVSVMLDERPSPELAPLQRSARDGVLARAMAAFLRWYAPRYLERLPELEARDRAAASSWGLGKGDRAALLMGALAHGLDELFEFLAPGGISPCGALDVGQLATHRARAESAMRAVAAGHGDNVAAESPERRFCQYVGDALQSGRAHVKALLPKGRTGTPKTPEACGWRQDDCGVEKVWRAQGPCIGYVSPGGAEVLLSTGPALEAATDRARAAGQPLGVDSNALGRMLLAANIITRTHGGKSTVQQRHGGMVLERTWAVHGRAIGYHPEDREEAE